MADTSIYSRFIPPERSMQDYLDEYDARDQRAMQNKLNSLMLQDKQRGLEEANQLRALYAQPDFNPATPEGVQRVMRVSPTQGIALQKGQLEADEKRSKIDKERAETLDRSLTTFRSFVPNVQTTDDVAAYVRAMYEHPTLGPLARQFGPVENVIASNQKLFATDPKKWMTSSAGLTGQQIVDALKGTRQNVNLGDVNQGSTVDIYGQVVPGSVTTSPIGQSADNRATVGASIANATAAREQAAATRDAANTQAAATRDAANIQNGFQNETALRKEFEGLSEVKNYKQAYPAFAAVKDAASRNTPQSDINIIYGIAKLYDPTSVVREGEYATVANSPNIPERIKGYAQFLQGGGRLSKATKEQLVQEAQGRLGTYKAEVDKARGSYEQIAKRRNIDPASVFQDMGDVGAQPSGSSNLRDAAAAELARRRGGN
jgi:hypothetical protein